MLHYQLRLNSFVFGSTSITIIVSFSKRKEKKLPTKCLLFKWDYIPLSLIELVSTNQFSCPSPFLPQYYLIYITLCWDETIIKV